MPATEKKVTRATLINAAKKGSLFIKCKYHYTDDYAGDAASNFGKMDDFCQVYIEAEYVRPANYDSMTHEQQDETYRNHCEAQRQIANGRSMHRMSDFRTKSGCVWGDKTKGTFLIHSNLSYEYEIRTNAN